MKRLLVVAAFAIFGLVGTAAAAPPQSLSCFGESPATCEVTQNSGAKLNTSAGGYAGVYLAGKNFQTAVQNQSISKVDFSFGYYCDDQTLDKTSCVSGGAPSYRIPISTDGQAKTTELYAVIDAANCDYTGTVSTNASNCEVFFLGGTGAGGATSYANWDAFAAANPTWVVSKDIPFIIQDVSTPTTVILYGVSATRS